METNDEELDEGVIVSPLHSLVIKSKKIPVLLEDIVKESEQNTIAVHLNHKRKYYIVSRPSEDLPFRLVAVIHEKYSSPIHILPYEFEDLRPGDTDLLGSLLTNYFRSKGVNTADFIEGFETSFWVYFIEGEVKDTSIEGIIRQ